MLKRDIYVSVFEAADIASVSPQTIRNWIRDFKIGTMYGGRYLVDKTKLDKVMKGELYYESRGKGRIKGTVKEDVK